MSKSLIPLAILSLTISTVEANPLLGVWQDQIWGEENPTTTLTFRSDNTCQIEAAVPEIERLGLFAEIFGEILHDLDLTLTDLQERGFKIPSITQIRMKGTYTVEDNFLTVHLAQFLLGIKGQFVDLGQLMANVASQLIDLLDKETTDLELIVALTVLAESGSLITDLVIEEMMEEEAFVASDFSIQGDRLQFQDGDFAEVVFVRQDEITSVKTTSWGQIKGRISN